RARTAATLLPQEREAGPSQATGLCERALWAVPGLRAAVPLPLDTYGPRSASQGKAKGAAKSPGQGGGRCLNRQFAAISPKIIGHPGDLASKRISAGAGGPSLSRGGHSRPG